MRAPPFCDGESPGRFSGSVCDRCVECNIQDNLPKGRAVLMGSGRPGADWIIGLKNAKGDGAKWTLPEGQNN